MTARLAFVVYGQPVGQGRISFYGKGRAVHSNAATLLPWRNNIANAAETAAAEQQWTHADGPVRLICRFYINRPRAHYLRHGLRPTAPERPIKRPDLDHYVRAVCDALAGCWHDDSQVVDIAASKHFTSPHGPMQTPGAVIELITVAP